MPRTTSSLALAFLLLAAPLMAWGQPVLESPPIPPCNADRLETDDALDPRQRACLFMHDLGSPSAILGAGFGAAYARMANNDPAPFGDGWSAFGIGLATRYTQSATKSAGEFLVAWATHDDPRRPRHDGTTRERFFKAAGELFRPAPLAGAFGGGFVALLWEDRNHTTVHQAAMHSLTSLAGSFVWLEFHEFQRELMRWLNNRFSPPLK